MEFVLLNQDTIDTFGVQIEYLMLRCSKCNHAWGVMVHKNQTLQLKDFICRNCAAKEKLKTFAK